MSSFVKKPCTLLCLLCYLIVQQCVLADDNNPYQFSFNIADFQHRYEEKDAEGLIKGDYGFITADSVYHETGYATDKDGDFIIRWQKHRKIASLKDVQEIFKDRPEVAKKFVEAVIKGCGGCKIPTDALLKPATSTESSMKKMDPILKQMMKTLSENIKHDEKKQPAKDVVKSMMRAAKKLLSEEDNPNKISDRMLENMANDLYYRFNYTITTHGHHEEGYRSGRKDGSYQSRDENGINTQVKYLSNEFGYQPNITFITQTNKTDEKHALKGYLFHWYWPQATNTSRKP